MCLSEHICIHGIWNWLPQMLHALLSHLGWVPCEMRRDSWGFGVIMQHVGSCRICRAASPYLTCIYLCLCVQMPGRFIPSCDEDGYYRKQQCDRGECWCVDQNGGEVAGSRIRGKPDCGKSWRFAAVNIHAKRILTWKAEYGRMKNPQNVCCGLAHFSTAPPHVLRTRLPLC